MSIQSIFKIFLPKKIQQSSVSILVIDDSEVDRRVASAAVERGGYKVLNAVDGKSGLEMAQKHKPALIILDYNMPDINGPEVCRVLKASEQTRHIPVLFLTSLNDPGSVIDCYDQGGENYLSKPINTKFLLEQINQTLKG